MNREELAWAAGFFDGEGHCSYTNRKINLAINQIDTYVLERFSAAVNGLGKIYKPKPKANPNHNDIFMWKTSNFEHTQAVIAMLWEFLSPIKRNDISRAMILNKANMSNNYKYTKRDLSYNGKIINKTTAMDNGLLKYFTGKKCKRGHVSERWIKGGRCLGCRAERGKL